MEMLPTRGPARRYKSPGRRDDGDGAGVARVEQDASGRGFASEDDEARHCLRLLRDGGAAERCAARDRLGRTFERRGLHDEAAACYEANLAEGVLDPSLRRRLAAVYRRQGRPDQAAELLAGAPPVAAVGDRPDAPKRTHMAGGHA